jgi:hypothetical protein
MAHWMDNSAGNKTGDFGFLIESYNQTTCQTYHYLSSHPGCKNMSGKPVLNGWLGDTNNICKHALGIGRVVRTTKNDRMLVVPVSATELPVALTALGYAVWELVPGEADKS